MLKLSLGWSPTKQSPQYHLGCSATSRWPMSSLSPGDCHGLCSRSVAATLAMTGR